MARESRAGDDFHLLWAARRSLALLDPTDSLAVVRIEGLSPADADEDDDRFLGVDVTEYHDGDSMATASLVVVTQLKYSVRHPNRPWTVARLASPGRGRGASVIRRLGNVFKGLVEQGRVDQAGLVSKLRIQLVSNQPAARELAALLGHAKTVLSDLPVGAKTSEIVQNLTSKERTSLLRLHERSGLPSAQFANFLRVLDVGGCGAEARLFQRLRLAQDIGRMTVGPHLPGLTALLDVIHHQTLPEGAGSPGLRRADVVAALGAGSEHDLLPAPTRFEVPPQPVVTHEPAALARALLAAPERAVLAHGKAGVGKTTTVLSLEAALPPGSVVVPYDCFGGGDYLSPGKDRHTASRALVQLANELMLRLGTRPLLSSALATDADRWRHFRERVEEAASVLGDASVLVIAVDAADNAVYGADRQGDSPFVLPMWDLPRPANVRLLMTCRTHRRGLVRPNGPVPEFELSGFDLDASTAMLRRVFPLATPADGAVFHDRTGGVPRVQAYLLTSEEVADIGSLLARSGKGLGEIFDDVVRAALDERPAAVQARREIATLFALTRPVRLATLATVLRTDAASAHDIAAALQPGLVVDGDSVRFPDEDFEHHLRDRLGPEEISHAHSRIADDFLERSATDSGASAALAEHLNAAGREDELVALAIREPVPAAIGDGLARTFVARRRIKLALNAASRVPEPGEALRLLFLAARAARSHTSLTTIIRERPELTARFADGEALAAAYLRADNQSWLGPAHFRAAAVLAWDAASRDTASQQMEQAAAWIRQWSFRDDDHGRRWSVTADDLAYGAAALYALHGLEVAVDFLRRWRPRDVVDAAVSTLARVVAAHLDSRAVARDLTRLGASTWVQAQFIAAFDTAGAALSAAWVRRVAGRMGAIAAEHKVLSKRPQWGLAFCEAAIRARASKRVVSALVARLAPRLPAYPPGAYDDLSDWVEALRAAALAARVDGRNITSDDLLPESLRPSTDRRSGEYDPDASKRESFKEALDPLLEVCRARARCLVTGTTVSDVAESLAPVLNRYREEADSRWLRPRGRYRTWALEATYAFARASGDATTGVQELLSVADRVLSRTASLRVQIAGALMPTAPYRDLALELLGEAAQEVATKAYSASDRREILLDAAAVAADVDQGLGSDLFAQAVDAAQGIDDDAGLCLGVLARMLSCAAPTLTSEDRRLLGERIARVTEAVSPFVSDPAEVLPHRQVIATVAELDPGSSFALASRWDDEDRLALADSVPALVHQVCASDALQPEEGLWLLRLVSDDQTCVRTGLELLDLLAAVGPDARSRLVDCFSVLADWTGRDVRLHERGRLASLLSAWANAHGLGTTRAATQVKDLESFVDSLHASAAAVPDPVSRVWEGSPTLESVAADLDPATLEVGLRQLINDYASEETVVDYLVRVVAAAGPQRRVQALRALIDVADEYSDRPLIVRGVAGAVRAAVDRWNSSIRVRHWASTALPKFVELHLASLFGIRSARYSGWGPVLQMPFDLTAERLPVLLRATAARIDELDVHYLYAIIEACTLVVPSDCTAHTVGWALGQVAPLDPPPQPPALPTSLPEVMAAFLWCAMGHPDERVRWRAAHACRGLLSTDIGAQFADGLVDRLDARTAGPFRAMELDFFWLSARMWTLMVLARVAAERPGVLKKHATRLAIVALDRELPHAACREFARRAALVLERASPGSIRAETLESLAFANVPLSCHSARRHRFEHDDAQRSGDRATRFQFDSMDTLPYWYQPLARVFGRDTHEVATRADRWVTDIWGRTHDECNNDPRRDRPGHEWASVRNDHGSRPLVETLRTYLEYHAMQVVAGELLDTGAAILVEPYDDAGSPWWHWLRRHLDADPGCWRADRRSATPLEPEFFGKVPDPSAFEECPETFDRLLGLKNDDARVLVVSSWVSTGDHDNYVTLRVASALVSSGTAGALLRALQTAEPRTFELPFADEGTNAWGNEIDEPGFQLLGWLRRVETSWSELDDHDPLAASGGDFRTMPEEDFALLNGLVVDATGCRFRSRDGETTVFAETWGDEAGPGVRHEIATASEGRRTWIRMAPLLRYLQHRRLDLILEANVWIYARERSSRKEEDEYGYERSRLYLLRGDGSLEVVGGRPGSGGADRLGTRPRRGAGHPKPVDGPQSRRAHEGRGGRKVQDGETGRHR